MVTVYGKPACVQCTATYTALERARIEFEVVDVTSDESALQAIKDLGYLQAPVVVVGDDHWPGFRPDRIGRLAALSES